MSGFEISAQAEEFAESPNLRVVMELLNTNPTHYAKYQQGDVLYVKGYIQENHGLTKVGNVLVDFFLEDSDGTKTTVAIVLTDEKGEFLVSIPLTTDYKVGKYLLSAEPSGLGYQKQLDSDRQYIEFFITKISEKVIPSPLKQIKAGTSLLEVKCNEGNVPVFKNNKMRVACVSPETESELIKRGWALRLNLVVDDLARSLCIEYGGHWLEEQKECEYISPEQCSLMKGRFNECESACRNDPEAQVCILLCVPVCNLS